MKRTLIGMMAVIQLAACVTFNPASSGMKVSDEAMTAIRDKVDTKETVVAKLGQPTRKAAKDGKDFWHYDYKVIGGNLKITEQETTTFEFNTNTGILTAHYKGAAPAVSGAASPGTSAADGDDWCKLSVYKETKGQLSKVKLDTLYQRCVADCKATYDKYRVGGDQSYYSTMYKSCTTAYMPGGAYYNAPQREKP